MKSSVTYVYFERYECDNFALENFIIINISAAILQFLFAACSIDTVNTEIEVWVAAVRGLVEV